MSAVLLLLVFAVVVGWLARHVPDVLAGLFVVLALGTASQLAGC